MSQKDGGLPATVQPSRFKQRNFIMNALNQTTEGNEISFIVDAQGNKQSVVISMELYSQILPTIRELKQRERQNDCGSTSSLIVDNGTAILLPYGGGEKLSLVELVDYLLCNNLTSLAINNRAQHLRDYPSKHLKTTLDPIVRGVFLRKEAYRNTMQVTTAVVDALEDTGLFIRERKAYDNFTRTVNGVRLDIEKCKAFLAEHQQR
jgi:hypothetical protein